ncbi:U-box domain-containing protein 26 isoform X2 [Ricinus communis]|nr:U-box domain-containing protein 26 isoform X2 [Ricinus communis]|eukprot:XP_015579328.1 U-box domain-containing protein 26 isoform X2 [Ricinus communis]
MGPQFDPDHHHHHHPVTINDSLASLKHHLQSHESTLEKKFQSLQRIQALSEESTTRILYLLQLGFFPLLLELLFQEVVSEISQESINFSEHALSCVLRLLPFAQYESLNMLKEESKLQSFKSLLEHGTSKMKVGLCHLIEAISSSSDTRELCSILGQNHGLLQGLVLLVQDNCEAPEAGIKAISALCSSESNRDNMVQGGVLKGLLTYISNAERCHRNLISRAMATIELLLELDTAKEAVINNPDGIGALVKMVFRVSDHEGSESAVRSLMILCGDSLQAREEAISAGVLTQVLLLLQSQCSGRTKTRARMLLKLLRSKWNEQPKNIV